MGGETGNGGASGQIDAKSPSDAPVSNPSGDGSVAKDLPAPQKVGSPLFFRGEWQGKL